MSFCVLVFFLRIVALPINRSSNLTSYLPGIKEDATSFTKTVQLIEEKQKNADEDLEGNLSLFEDLALSK